MTKIVVNRCFGGFGLSDAAYARLAELGIRVGKYVQQVRGENGLYNRPPENQGEVIFDRELTPLEELEGYERTREAARRAGQSDRMHQRYWESFTRSDAFRADPRLVQVVEELGAAANGGFAKLEVVTIPDGVDWEIDEYDGSETVHEKHRSW